MSDSFFDYYLSVLTGFIVACYILLSGGTIIEAIFAALFTVGLTLLGGTIIKIYLEPKLIFRRERKEVHRKKLIDEILKPLQHSVIQHKNFKVWIDDLEGLEKQEEFELAFKHLQHKNYLDILTSWEKTRGLIDDLNEKLRELEIYLDSKIPKKKKSELSRYIWDLVQVAFYKDTKIDDLKIKKIEEKNIIIPRNANEECRIPLILGETKTKNLLSKIINKKFLDYMKEIQEINNKLREEFNDKFQKFLKELISSINDKESEFKGYCKKCSFWGDK